MVANADKSSVIMGIRGTSARKWIQSHQVVRNGQKFVNFGLPSAPLLVPSVKQFGYLGVQVSYGAFEMQTLLFRQQAASANRARLVRILHHRQLALRRRVSLYLSCVRSSLIFGLHATLRKLDATDSRHLRAIAKSPSHITKESTTALRLRLRVQSPEEAIVALLRRRIACCQEAASVEDLQSHLSALLSNAHTSEGVSPSPSIVPCNAKQPVACPVCGVYFDSMRHMLSHQARQHGCQLPKVPLPKSTDYTAHTVQCLPQCKHCLGVFTRVEAFKKASAAVLSCTSRRDDCHQGKQRRPPVLGCWEPQTGRDRLGTRAGSLRPLLPSLRWGMPHEQPNPLSVITPFCKPCARDGDLLLRPLTFNK